MTLLAILSILVVFLQFKKAQPSDMSYDHRHSNGQSFGKDAGLFLHLVTQLFSLLFSLAMTFLDWHFFFSFSHRLFLDALTCAGCSLPLNCNDLVCDLAMGNDDDSLAIFHHQCAKCYTCQQPINTGDQYRIYKRRLYCPADHSHAVSLASSRLRSGPGLTGNTGMTTRAAYSGSPSKRGIQLALYSCGVYG